ncbi:Growth_factor receptor cysteine-rich domain superfamily [Hexamita inflata]|uniref:Growth factor receptor cysteine-rich domain superfamily n=1 Tax=Hexamita inflata TaxID=28002 RepID=A0AA86NFF5_9EUKA|nr:Growth factor receptor cysteine-rich domain superfamily [Hexamita inflata]CAI9918862.1 Growth factor receptor cysteine-rich domain superfamily [Hexamita inflata]
MMIVILSILAEEVTKGPLCGRGFSLQKDECKCSNLLGSDLTSCVVQCQDNEVEANGRCITIKAKNTAENCTETFGISFELNAQNECACPENTDCYCRTDKCCQSKGKHLINNQCDDCLTAFGTGYSWNDQKNTCTCSTGCICTTQLCCSANGLIFIDGKCAKCQDIFYNTGSIIEVEGFSKCRCDPNFQEKDKDISKPTDKCINEYCDSPNCKKCADFGTGFIWDANIYKCVCSQAPCICKTQECCNDQFQNDYINGECSTCEAYFGEGAIQSGINKDTKQMECSCDKDLKYYGSLVSKQHKCEKCQVRTMFGCATCENEYGDGFTYDETTQQCICQDENTCNCKSKECCNKYNKGFNTDHCTEQCDNTQVPYDNFCTCDESKHYYKISAFDSTCEFCEGILKQNDQFNMECILCQQAYGTGYSFDKTSGQCVCLKGTSCQCTSEICCQINSTHLINNKCTSCLQAFGFGYSFNQQTNKCQCEQEAICKCTTELCCHESNQIFLNGKCVDCAKYGTNYITDLAKNLCSCPQNKVCSCTSEECCNSQQKTYKSNQCSACEITFVGSKFENGKCVCDESQKYAGELKSESSQCIKCTELLINGKCQKCTDLYSEGTIYKDQTCVCNTAEWYIGTLLLSTSRCQKCSEGINSDATACTTCLETYGTGAVISGGNVQKHCKCDEENSYAGKLNSPQSKCVHCAELIVYDTNQFVCKTCQEHQGLGFIYDDKNNLCKCDSRYVLSESGDKCDLCDGLVIQNNCVSCEQKYGFNSIFKAGACVCNDHSINKPTATQMCYYCDEVADKVNNVCKLCTDVHGPGAHYNNNKCMCNEFEGYVGNLRTNQDKCQKCPELTDGGKCILCSDKIPNAFYNTQKQMCECSVGYQRTGLFTCDKIGGNKTTGVIVGVVIGGIVLLIIISVFVVKCKQQKKIADAETTRGVVAMRGPMENNLPQMLETVQ